MEKSTEEQAKEARRAYQREYARTHRDIINKANRKWTAKNKDKVQQNQMRYWLKKAQQQQADGAEQ